LSEVEIIERYPTRMPMRLRAGITGRARHAPGLRWLGHDVSTPYVARKEAYEVVSSDTRLYGAQFANRRWQPISEMLPSARFGTS
jgi:hypothetical protein